MKPRKLALDLLLRLEKNDQFSNILLDRALSAYEMSEADKALVSALVYGVTERKLTLDYRISSLSSRPIGDIDKETLSAIRMGLYQLIYMDRIPPHAAINESVELCSRRSAGFANAILRSHTRRPELELPNKTDDPVRYASVRYSVIPELATKLISAYGRERAYSILEAFEQVPDTTISVNTLKISRDELLSHIDGATKTDYAPNGLRVKGSVRNMYGFEDGFFFVQDEASQICVEAIGAKEGNMLLDICACPGSKSFGAAIAMKNEGQVISFDLHAKKLPLIVSGANRLGITIIDARERDGRDLIPELVGQADRVICDVPCSGFGVLSKKPELRYKDPSLSAALPDIQLSILENACKYVKEGGTLVYSTCTVFPEENEENIKRFLEKHPEFSLSPFSVGELDFPNGYMTLLPDVLPTDGFFIARLIRS